jgi:aspartate/methionine/tyrosine aminotransferase
VLLRGWAPPSAHDLRDRLGQCIVSGFLCVGSIEQRFRTATSSRRQRLLHEEHEIAEPGIFLRDYLLSIAMKLPDFKLERYFARWEFAAPYLLCASDAEPCTLAELLAPADDDDRRRWSTLSLGYTESAGHPALREAIAALYDTVTGDDVVVFSGAEEAIFAFMNVVFEPGDHAVVTWPGYQSLYAIPEAAGAEVSRLVLRHEEGWVVDVDAVGRFMRPATRAVVVNFPHSPTGALPSREVFEAIVRLAEERGAVLFSDEVYRFLERSDGERLPAAVDLSPSAVSLGVMSKAFGLAGLRIGWLVCRDPALRARLLAFKDYLTICSAAPSEVLAIIALRHREAILERNRAILRENVRLADELIGRWSGVLEWVPPRAGTTAFPRLLLDMSVERFAERLVECEGVVLLPGTVFDHPGNHFRLGLGRRNAPEGLERLERFLRGIVGGS